MLADTVTHGGLWDIVLSLWIPVLITAGASVYIAKVTRGIKRDVDTGNEKNAGETIHDMNQTLEILSAQIHTNTAETLGARAKAEAAAEKAEKAVVRLEDWIAESTHVHAELLRRLPPDEKGDT